MPRRPARAARPRRPQPPGIAWFEPPEIPFRVSPFLQERMRTLCDPADQTMLVQRLRYASFVDPTHRILYVETPKVASTSILLAFNAMHGRHSIRPFTGTMRETKPEMFVHSRKNAALLPVTAMSDDLQAEIFTSKDWLRFCFVRNPFTRLFSLWLNKYFIGEPGSERAFELLERPMPTHLTRVADSIGFEEFVTGLVARIEIDSADQHFQYQERLLQPDFFEYGLIGRIENLADDFARVQAHAAKNGGTLPMPERHNPTLEAWRGFYDKTLAAIVAEVYARDFARFGYDTALDGRSLAAARRKSGPEALETRIGFYNEIFKRNRLFAQLYELELGPPRRSMRLRTP